METTLLSPKDTLLQTLSEISALTDIHPQSVQDAQQLLQALDFPTTRTEAWKYTRTSRLSSETWEIKRSDAQIDITPFRMKSETMQEIVFVNGFFRHDLSSFQSADDLILLPYRQLAEEKEIKEKALSIEAVGDVSFFTTLNTVHCTDGFFFLVKNTTEEKNIHFIFLTTGDKVLAMPRITGIVESEAAVHVINTYASTDEKKAWTNAVVEIEVADHASLTWDKIQQESEQHFCLVNEYISQREHSKVAISTLTVDGGWVRNNLNIYLNGSHSESHLYGFYLPRKNHHIDNHTLVDHLFPECESNELYKGVLFDKGRAVFNGKVFVRPDAQKTNAYQNNANVMMSDDATVNTKPELEIYADDVKCSHGTTTGCLDEAAMFYLRSRGIGEDSSRKMLTTAFIGEVLEKVKSVAVRDHVRQLLQERALLL